MHGVGLRLWCLLPLLTLFQLCRGSSILMELQGVKNNKTSVSRTYQYTCIYTCSICNQEEEAKTTCTIVQQMVDQNFIKIY